jgi:hypothetical protein
MHSRRTSNELLLVQASDAEEKTSGTRACRGSSLSVPRPFSDILGSLAGTQGLVNPRKLFACESCVAVPCTKSVQFVGDCGRVVGFVAVPLVELLDFEEPEWVPGL